MPVDPVCGMHVEEQQAAATTEHEGRTYYFCSEGCKSQFETDPGKFVARLDEERGESKP